MLSRYRIVDCTDRGAALCGQILADLGADVVLVEPPGGAASRHVGPYAGVEPDAERSLHFWATQRNKRSAVLDLETEAGRQALQHLLEDADAWIHPWTDVQLTERGLLAERPPELVTVAITPFGLDGPKTDWAATDLTITAASGQLLLCGDEDRAPLCSSLEQAFLHAGAEAASGTLLALAARERDGLGQRVDVSAQTAMMQATQSFALSHGWNDPPLQRLGGGVRLEDIRLRFVYPCRDGYANFTLLFGPALGPATARMFEWLYDEGFIDKPTRDKDWIAYAAQLLSGAEPISELERVTEALERFTRAHTKAELLAGAFERRVLIVPMSDMADLVSSPQLKARDFWTSPAPGQDDVPFPGPFAKLSATPICYRRAPPRVGEHSDDVLSAEPRPRAVPTRAPVAERPLHGLKVLDFSWVYAGPAVTRVLADYGATVVRIESLTRIDALRVGQPFKDSVPGIERSGGYSNMNAGKLGLGLNMTVPEARELALQLVDWADVIVENFSPRAMKKWGLDYQTLSSTRPGLVMLSSCLNGQTGPESALAGYGTMGASLAGFGFLTGWPDRPPSGPLLAYTDYVSPRFATAALLAAIDVQRRTGKGQHVDLAQSECGVHFLGPPALDYLANGAVWKAHGNAHREYAPSGVYPCQGDDRWLALAAPDGDAWQRLCASSGAGWERDARFATTADRLANRAELDLEISAWTKGFSADALEARLQDARLPAHRVSTSTDLFADPQLAAREHFVWLEHVECGLAPLEGARARLSRTPGAPQSHGPTVGEHNEFVLRELLGMSDEQMTELVISGALE